MKKSQILAALALAFALGVAVIPTASTYATITSNTATDTQKAEIYDQAKDLLADAASLENYAQYKELYNSFKNDASLMKALQELKKNQLREFNLNLTSEQYVNVYINRFNDILARRASEIEKADISNKDHAKFQTIPAFTTASTLEAAYNSIENVMKIVNADLEIMRSNYNYVASADNQSGNVIWEINNQLAAIVWTLETRSDSLIKNLGTALSTVENNYSVNAAGISHLAQLIEQINESAYDQLTTNAEWVANPGADSIKLAKDLGLIIKTAQGLPKYNLAGAVASAEANVALIPVNSGIDVDYANAKAYITSLTTAIKNYREGKTDNGNQGEGTNKPDNKPDQNAPDTGILADAEGSASTTVAMVAGIATALTAAGAGVVAYRNARRSSRK